MRRSTAEWAWPFAPHPGLPGPGASLEDLIDWYGECIAAKQGWVDNGGGVNPAFYVDAWGREAAAAKQRIVDLFKDGRRDV